MEKSPYIITIDGPSGVGKSTVAKTVASRLGYCYLDTGAMYRAFTLAALEAGLVLDPPDLEMVITLLDRIDLVLDRKGRVILDGKPVEELIRKPLITRAVSAVAALEPVRSYLIGLQRAFANEGPLVAEGRDLGSVVFPEAPFKFYLDADPEERARRRAEQQNDSDGKDPSAADVYAALQRRDRLDSQRALSPLRRCPDMVKIDTTRLCVEEVVEAILHRIKK